MRDNYRYEYFNRRFEESVSYGDSLRVSLDTTFNRAMKKGGKANPRFTRSLFTRAGRRGKDDPDGNYKTIHFRPVSLQPGNGTYRPTDRPSERFIQRWGQ